MPNALARATTPKFFLKADARQADDMRKLSTLGPDPDMATLRRICLDESLVAVGGRRAVRRS
jgi:hypothetical protein